MMSAPFSMIPVGYEATVDHVGSAGGPAFVPGSSPSVSPPSQPGSNDSPPSLCTWRSGAPFMVRIWKEPPRSDNLTSAGAEPVFLIVTFDDVVVPSTWLDDTDGGVIVNWPALRVKSALVALSAATETVLLAPWYGDLVALNACEPVRDENSQ